MDFGGLFRNIVPWFPGDDAPAQPLPPPQTPENDLTNSYNTPLSPPAEQAFQQWAKDQNLGPNHSYDYDMRGMFAKNGPVEHLAGEHFTDEFKKPNHPTFSTGSIYHGVNGNEGGQWVTKPDGTWDFVPSQTNLQNLGGPGLWNYFGRVEPRNQVQLPGVAQPPDVSVGPFDQLRRLSAAQPTAVDIYRRGVGLPPVEQASPLDRDPAGFYPGRYDPFEIAAARTRESVMPIHGREEGLATQLTQSLPGAIISAPFRAVGQGADAMRRVYEGELNPLSPEGIGEAFQAGAQVLGQSPFAGRNTLGAGGGKMVQSTVPKATTGGVEDTIRAYHGSPHDFERFDLSKIGTGEGAQAYGHGLYFAENEGVAHSYKSVLEPAGTTRAKTLLKFNNNDVDAAIAQAKTQMAERPSEAEAYKGAIEQLNKVKSGGELSSGKMYQVGIRANPEHFLDWDKPLSEQHPAVGEKLKEIVRLDPNRTVADWINNSAGAEQRLRDAGIPGIKYLDQGSRTPKTLLEGKPIPQDHTAAQLAAEKLDIHGSPEAAIASLRRDATQGHPYIREDAQRALDLLQSGKVKRHQPDGTRNFVVFDDKLIDILKKYGIAGIGALPAMNAYHYQDK